MFKCSGSDLFVHSLPSGISFSTAVDGDWGSDGLLCMCVFQKTERGKHITIIKHVSQTPRRPAPHRHKNATQSHMDTHETSLDKSSLPLDWTHALDPQAPYWKQGRFLFFKAHICQDGPNPELRQDTAM